jgi:glycine cleavage system H protein
VPGGVLVSSGHCWASLAEDGNARVGLDDFAKKLLGRVDRIELPEVGARIRAGEQLFKIRQGDRQASFNAPLSGKVVAVNSGLSRDGTALDASPYGNNWVCVIEGDDLDNDLARAKIGKSAVALFQEDLDRFGEFMRKAGEGDGSRTLSIGAFEELDDDQWNAAVSEFFAR